MISLDALFGLPRQKLAGQSHRKSLHGSLLFTDQASVDSFVDSQKPAVKDNHDLLVRQLYSYILYQF